MKSLIGLFEQQAKGTTKWEQKSKKKLLLAVINSRTHSILNLLLYIHDRSYNLAEINLLKCFKVSQIVSLPNLYEKITKKTHIY